MVVTQAPDNPDELPKQAGNKTECALLQFCDSVGEEHEHIREKHTEDTFTKVRSLMSVGTQERSLSNQVTLCACLDKRLDVILLLLWEV